MATKRLGIDVGYTGFKITEVSIDKGKTTVLRQVFLKHSTGFLSGGRIDQTDEKVAERKVARIAAELKAFLRDEKITTKDVILGFHAVGQVYGRRTKTAFHEPKFLRDQLQLEVSADAQLLGVTGDNLVVDYCVINAQKDENDEPQLDMFLAGLREQPIREFVDFLSKAGLRVVGVDLSILAALRAVRLPVRGMDELDVFVDLGEDVTQILIHSSGTPLYLQVLSGLGGLTADASIIAEMSTNVATDVIRNKIDADTRDFKAQMGLETYFYKLARAIETAMSNYLADSSIPGGYRGVCIVGGTANTPGLIDFLAEELTPTVIIGQVDARKFELATAETKSKGQAQGPLPDAEVIQFYEDKAYKHDFTTSLGLTTGKSV